MTHNFEVYAGLILPAPTLPDIGASYNVVLQIIEHMLCQNQKKLLIYFDKLVLLTIFVLTLSNTGFTALGAIHTRRFPGLEFLGKDMKSQVRVCLEEKETIIDGVNICTILLFS